ncbi:MAG: class I SAM-dependent methyltransferase [Candidatus Nanopelagicales bacterium]|nr:class I SAM-dependent methyltransferase [Candidatus Nanopelagicales bacterium]
MFLLSHPLTRGLDPDDPSTTLLRRKVIRNKSFLRRLYAEWYELLCSRLPNDTGQILEIGSGAGFLSDYVPEVITSEVFPLEGVDQVEDATALSFADASLAAIVMTDVLHHIPNVASFFAESTRTLRIGGRLVMIEPWNTAWSRFVYQRLHSEPFLPEAADWRLPTGGPLSTANGALPWIVFKRDRERFELDFPELAIVSVEPLMPMAYLASGGVSMRSLAPGFMYPAVRNLEGRVLREHGAMFALIVIERLANRATVNGVMGST